MAELNVQELNERALNLIHEARNILDERADEDGNLKAEDLEQYERMMDQVDSLNERIEQVQRAEDAEKRAAQAREQLEQVVDPDVIEDREQKETSELRSWLAAQNPDHPDFGKTKPYFDIPLKGIVTRSMPGGSWEVRDLITDTAAAGGNLVPTGFRQQLYEHMVENSAIRQTNVTVLTTQSGNDLQIPRTTSFGTAAIVGEGTALAEADPAFGQVTLNSWKYGQLLQLSNELITDEAVDLNGFLARDMGRALGNASGAHYITGTGTNQPRGVITAAANDFGTAVQVASATVEFDNLLDLEHSVNAPYRRNAFFLMEDQTFRDIRKIKDADGNYIYERSMQAGAPGRLLGYPVVTDPNVASRSSGNLSVAFGDFSGYFIRDVQGVRIERSEHFAFSSDLVTVRAIIRTDGDLIDSQGNVHVLDTD